MYTKIVFYFSGDNALDLTVVSYACDQPPYGGPPKYRHPPPPVYEWEINRAQSQGVLRFVACYVQHIFLCCARNWAGPKWMDEHSALFGACLV